MTQETDNHPIPPASFHFTNGAAFSALKDACGGAFWSQVKNLFLQSKKHFIKPAAMLLIGPFVIMGGFYFGSLGMGDGVQDLAMVMIRYLVCFTLGSLGGTVLIVWSIADWLLKLTAFCRSYINGQSLEESLEFLKTRKGFLFVAWFVYMILMTPFIIFIIASGLVSLMQFLPQPLALPDYVDTVINVITAIGMIFTTMYAALLIPVTGISEGKGSSAAFSAFVGSFKIFVPLLLFSILANIIYCLTMELVLTGFFIKLLTQPATAVLTSVPTQTAEQVTLIFSSAFVRGIASFFVLPFLIALPAEITKRAIKN